ncbi:MAG: hypothetical protein J2P48_24365, partial [Alphaproteobacteria bacterium]|nr:hypothetical protein [Alphaproteobacteria bacterium]
RLGGARSHRELGGSDPVASGIQHATPMRIGFGERLDHALGGLNGDPVRLLLNAPRSAVARGASLRQAAAAGAGSRTGWEATTQQQARCGLEARSAE